MGVKLPNSNDYELRQADDYSATILSSTIA